MSDTTISRRISLGDHSFHVRISPSQGALYDRIAKYAETTYEDIVKQGFKKDQAMAMAAFQIAIAFFESRDEVHDVRVPRERLEALLTRTGEALDAADEVVRRTGG